MADDELPNFDIISSLGLQAPESEAKNSGQKNEETNNQRRFAQLDVEELNDVVNDSQAKRTKKATQWAVTVFAGWLQKSRSIFNFYYRKKYNNNKQQQFKPKLWCWEQMFSIVRVKPSSKQIIEALQTFWFRTKLLKKRDYQIKCLANVYMLRLFQNNNFLKAKRSIFISAELSKQKEIGINLAEMTITELDESLRHFFAEARNKEGEN